MTPSRFETGRPLLLAGLRRWYAFSDGPDQIPLAWKDFVARLPLPGQIGGRTYGATCQTDMAGERFEYLRRRGRELRRPARRPRSVAGP
jgi:hypothetical protein